MIQIITDSSSLYTPSEARQAGFESVPLCVSIGDSHERDLLLDMEEYYRKIEQGLLPTSSQPPLGDVIEVFEAYAGSSIINISMADGLSGTYQTACGAREMVKNKDQITVFNSRTLCGPHRYMVTQAQKMKEDGCSFQEILDWLERAARNTESFLIPQDFSFLKRGGRLTPLAAATGIVLKLKPIMKLTEDGTRLDKFGVKRTMISAAQSIIDYLREKELGSQHILYISHANALEDAQKMKVLFEQAFPGLEVVILELSAVFVAQGGPRCVAIQYIKR
ncbi:MAG: DegV family protein [Hungatella sp.]|jgi:DegV family protein with EDD domain|nr:DegV family protein [Hungatella sp.]